MFVLAVLAVCARVVVAQSSKEQVINSIFGDDFLKDYEEVTQPPLKSIGALAKCGEGEQRDQFVCVPYYNCDPDTKTVQENAEIDGSNKIDIRMGEESKCAHYLDICCQVPQGWKGGNNNNNTNNGNSGGGDVVTPSPTTPTPPAPVTDGGSSRNNTNALFNCGLRNNNGLDFNLIGGTNEANFGEFPWMVAVLRKNPGRGETIALCGGSLITPKVVLTGAHCVFNVSVDDIKVRAGEWDTQTTNERIPFQERNVAQVIVHEFFIKSNLYNDVALLVLDRAIAKTDSIGTVCLPQQDQRFDSRECFATGWGKNIFGLQGQYAVILKKLQLPLVQQDQCQKALRTTRLGAHFTLHRSFTCAGGEPNLDTCTGDGGSPLVCPDPKNPKRYLQVGIVAWGIGCGENQIPGVYADVAGFRSWIDTKLQEVGIGSAPYSV